jgi:hypothetical protein
MEELVTDYVGLRDACESVFRTRRTHGWPPALDVPPHWIGPFARLAGELDLTVSDALGNGTRSGVRRTDHLCVGTAHHGNRATRCGNRPALQPGALFEAVVATIANDDVVDHLHAEQRAGLNESTGQLDIVSAGARIAARMVVRLMCRRSLCGRGQWKPPSTPVDTLIAGT